VTLMENDFEVIVVGSGMGGSTTAFGLAQKGKKVLVLERGSRIPKESQNWSPEDIFIKKRYRSSELWLDKDDKEFEPGVHYVVGGNTKLYGASLPRFKECDFLELKHREGISPSWPFSYADIEPYYYQAEELYKVHGSEEQDPGGPWRSKPFPYPSIEHEPYVKELADRLSKAGVTPIANSMGIDIGPKGNCIRCNTCDGFICKLDAKSDAEINALNPAIKTGNVELRTDSHVTKIVLTSDGKSVDYLLVSGVSGEYKVRGKKFVISAGAVNTAALLLNSKSDSSPNGIANSSDQVGRNFMKHNNSHILVFDWRRRNNVIFQKTLSFSDWYSDGGEGYPLGTVQLIGKVQGIMMKSVAKMVPLPILNYIAGRSVEFLVMSEDLPSPENRVTVDSNGRIKTTRNPRGVSTHTALMQKTRKILLKIGYKAIFIQEHDISMNAHQCGTTVAGKDPKTSVVDQYCKTHDVDNLYLIDGGFFPSSGAMNPALTIAAQALRVVAESDLAR